MSNSKSKIQLSVNTQNPTKTVAIGIGSNIGEREIQVRRALQEIHWMDGLSIQTISPIYRTPALTPEGSPQDWQQEFLNLVLLGQTQLGAQELLAQIKAIEKKLGRKSSERWAPRVIDLDLLIFGQDRVESENLQIPHPEISKREFVLAPLVDLWPEACIDFRSGLRAEVALAKLRRSHGMQVERAWSSQIEILRPKLMGIVNLTPDSFSDGGKFLNPEPAKAQIAQLIKAGADILDLGGESTRPGALEVPADEEWARLHEPLKMALELGRASGTQVSVDTRKPSVAERAIEQGVHIINDVEGLQNPAMVEVLKNSDCHCVFMHSLSVPVKKEITLPTDSNTVTQLIEWAQKRIEELEQKGIPRDRLVFDPGIGFGKTPEQSWQILSQTERFRALKIPALIGHSRKSFLNPVSQHDFKDRDPETLAVSSRMKAPGVEILRVHDVDLHRRGLSAALSLNDGGQW